MKVACLCPTYGRPRLIENAITLFRMQSIPAEQRRIYILDDGAQLPETDEPDLRIIVRENRFPSLPDKYVLLAQEALRDGCTHFALWDDDDIYLPKHLETCLEVMEREAAPWAKAQEVWSTYTGKPEIESSAGRFWASIVFTADSLAAAGGFVMTKRADFDQQFLSRLQKFHGPPATPAELTYVFRWNDTGSAHAQHEMRFPEDEKWYERCGKIAVLPKWPVLNPRLDEATVKTLRQIEARLAEAP